MWHTLQKGRHKERGDASETISGALDSSQPLVWFLKNYSMPWQAWVLILQHSVVIFLVYIYSEVSWLSSLVSLAMIANLHLTKSAFDKKA